MKVWITRDNDACYTSRIAIWNYEATPKLEESEKIKGFKRYVGDEDSVILSYYLIKNFKKDFDFIPRKSSCKEYELNLKKR